MNTFLNTFLRHHYQRAVRGELTNVLKHCHVYGMWSIMLHDEPGNRVRIFFADYNHKLHLNDNFDEKLQRFARVYQTLMSQRPGLQYIDLDYADRIVVKKS